MQKSRNTRILPFLLNLLRLHSRFANAVWIKAFQQFYEGDFEKNGKRIYHEHNDKIRSLVASDRLLEYHIQEGWKPLCEFLGIEQPKEAFPRENDAGRFRQRFRRLIALMLRDIVVEMMRWVLVILVAVYAFNWAKAKIRLG